MNNRENLLVELNKKVQEYSYNKYDNSYMNECVYKIIDNDLLPGEKFKLYNNFDRSTYEFRKFTNTESMRGLEIEVSNLGRVKINDKVVKQFQRKYGWLVVKIDQNITYEVYRLVAETFVACPVKNTFDYEGRNCWTVHHITDNGFDNRPDNLVWLSWNEHLKIKHKTRINTQIVKDELYKNLVDSLSVTKEREVVLAFLEDFYLLRKTDDDLRIIDKVCENSNIDISELVNNSYITIG